MSRRGSHAKGNSLDKAEQPMVLGVREGEILAVRANSLSHWVDESVGAGRGHECLRSRPRYPNAGSSSPLTECKKRSPWPWAPLRSTSALAAAAPRSMLGSDQTVAGTPSKKARSLTWLEMSSTWSATCSRTHAVDTSDAASAWSRDSHRLIDRQVLLPVSAT